MRIQGLLAVIVVLFAALPVSVSAAPGAKAAGAEAQEATGLVRAVRNSTRRFHDVAAAEAEGYGLFLGCVSGHEEGAMGIHYVNGDVVADPTLDPQRPEALIYEAKDGRLQLIAVEFVVIAADWDAANPTPPVLMGQTFNYTDSPNRYGLPPFYELHVWAWKNNEHGMFVDFNPAVSCADYAAK